MRQAVNPSEADLQSARADLQALQAALQGAIVGQEHLIIQTNIKLHFQDSSKVGITGSKG